MLSIYHSTITIELLLGGFVMTYPKKVSDSGETEERWEVVREVFQTKRKLLQRIKEVTDYVSLTAE